MLNLFVQMPVVASYDLGGSQFEVTVVIDVLIVAFAFLEVWPGFQVLTFPRRWLSLSGPTLRGMCSTSALKTVPSVSVDDCPPTTVIQVKERRE